MPKKSNKRRMMSRMKTRMKTKTRNQKPVLMIGCSVPKVNTKNYLSLGNKSLKNRYKYKKLKGGLGCGSSGCPLAPLSTKQMNQLGGTCNTCSQLQQGGKIPPPFVPSNSAWGPSVNKWPGVDGVSSSRNYLSPYNTNNDPNKDLTKPTIDISRDFRDYLAVKIPSKDSNINTIFGLDTYNRDVQTKINNRTSVTINANGSLQISGIKNDSTKDKLEKLQNILNAYK